MAVTSPRTSGLSLTVNGQTLEFEIDSRTSLLDLLREQLGLTGAKKGCDHGQCGACTVHVDGRRVVSCLTLARPGERAEVTTIEGLAQARRCIRCSRRSSITMRCSAAIARRARSWRQWPASARATHPR